MRADAIGLFWQDVPRAKGDRVARVMPPIPETGWQAPTDFPNLSRAKAIAVDVETYDPDLLKYGPGWARGVGHLVGIAAGTEDGHRWYFPMRHEVQKEDNLDPEHVLAWARDNLQNPDQPKIGANITYDAGWLRQEGVHLAGMLYDVQFAEALLYEARTVALDDLGERYLGMGKTSNLLYEWCAAYYSGAETGVQRKNIYRAPPCLVGPYAESDVDLPFRVIEKQWPQLHEAGLMELFDMETKLIPLMLEMRFRGVRVDIDRAEQLRDRMTDELVGIDAKIKDIAGFAVNTNASSDMAKAFDNLGLSYGYTPKGSPSFTKAFLKTVEHPLVRLLLKKREREKLRSTFLEGYILDSNVDGRLYGQFHPLRGDAGGTRSGRYSSSTPNLQNIPSRSKLGKLIRQCFVPDFGHRRWIKADYSQIEYRALAHYAVGPGSDEVRARYAQDANTDFHVAMQDIIRSVTAIELERPAVKTINFGTLYGMGRTKLASDLGLTKQAAGKLFDSIHHAAPFVRATMDSAIREAETTGMITTVLGRRSHFDMWVPQQWSEDLKPLPLDQALRTYVNPKRAYTHKALNRRLQGTAADLLKKAMLHCYESGLFEAVGYPSLTVHDELDFSDPGGLDHVFQEIYQVMENSLPLRVPVKVGVDIGPNWGEVVEDQG